MKICTHTERKVNTQTVITTHVQCTLFVIIMIGRDNCETTCLYSYIKGNDTLDSFYQLYNTFAR